jgi:uncharacterized protein
MTQHLTCEAQALCDRLNVMPDQISDFCQKWNLAGFALFGSVLREDFRTDPERPSDVDVLFTYGENARKNCNSSRGLSQERRWGFTSTFSRNRFN